MKSRAILLLAAYDSQALYLTLQSLTKTTDKDETIVVVLNGKHGIRSAMVEDVARDWAKQSENYHVVRPLNYGKDPYTSLKQVLEEFEPLKEVEYICKIDDDLVPLKMGWMNDLQKAYISNKNVGFTTGLINNNPWGFSELLNIFNKKEEYKEINNFKSESGEEGIINPGDIASGLNGTIWQFPYLSKWCHQWTLLDIENYIKNTEVLGNKEIPLDTHYSIGCIFFKKDFWSDLQEINNLTNFDERSVHLYCKNNNLKKIAVMSQPMGHLFFYVQRKANMKLMPEFANSLSSYWKAPVFNDYPKFDLEILLAINTEENISENEKIIKNIQNMKVVFRSMLLREKFRKFLKRIFK